MEPPWNSVLPPKAKSDLIQFLFLHLTRNVFVSSLFVAVVVILVWRHGAKDIKKNHAPVFHLHPRFRGKNTSVFHLSTIFTEAGPAELRIGLGVKGR